MVVGEYVPTYRRDCRIQYPYAPEYQQTTVWDSVTYADSSKNEATWYVMLGHFNMPNTIQSQEQSMSKKYRRQHEIAQRRLRHTIVRLCNEQITTERYGTYMIFPSYTTPQT